MSGEGGDDIELRHGALTARVARTGAELRSLTVAGRELMWQPQAGVWAQTAPWLFPFVGRLRGGGFLHRGRWYEMPLHGFAAASRFDVLAQQADALRLALRADDATRAVYPFEFRLQIDYRLDAAGLGISLHVVNDGDNTLPFALGGHPGFALPGALDDWRLRFSEPEPEAVWRLQPDPPPWGLRASAPEHWQWDAPAELQLRADLFARDALILDPVRSQWVALVHRHRGETLRLLLGGSPQLGLWSRPGSAYICIEPWWGRDDDADAPLELLAKPQVQRVAAGGCFDAAMRIELCGADGRTGEV